VLHWYASLVPGYLFNSGVCRINGSQGLRFIVQSAKAPKVCESRVEAFLEHFLVWFYLEMSSSGTSYRLFSPPSRKWTPMHSNSRNLHRGALWSRTCYWIWPTNYGAKLRATCIFLIEVTCAALLNWIFNIRLLVSDEKEVQLLQTLTLNDIVAFYQVNLLFCRPEIIWCFKFHRRKLSKALPIVENSVSMCLVRIYRRMTALRVSCHVRCDWKCLLMTLLWFSIDSRRSRMWKSSKGTCSSARFPNPIAKWLMLPTSSNLMFETLWFQNYF